MVIVDYSELERQINRNEDPSEAWLKQNAKVNRVSSANIQAKLGIFEELKAKSNDSWETRRTTIRDSGGPIEYGRSYLKDNRESGEAATITTPFNVDDAGEVKHGTLVRQHIAQLESQQSSEETTASKAGTSHLRREGAFRKKSANGNGVDHFADQTKPLETVSMSNEETLRDEVVSTMHVTPGSSASNTWVGYPKQIPQDSEARHPSAIGQYENAVIERRSNVDSQAERESANLDPNVGDWPDERDYARSDRSEIGSESNFTNSRVGAGSQVYEEDEEDIRYEPRSSLQRTSEIFEVPFAPYPPPANLRRSPPPSYHSAEDNISHQRMTSTYSESRIHEDEGDNAFSALDDAAEGYIPNDGGIDSDDSGSGRRVSTYRPSTPKPGVIRHSEVLQREDAEDNGIDMTDIVIGDDDPAFNQTMIF